MAAVSLLFQLGLAVWHGTAYLAIALGAGGDNASSVVMCHAEMGQNAVDDDGTSHRNHDSTCCRGFLNFALTVFAPPDVQRPEFLVEQLSVAFDALVAGNYRLAPVSRGPPPLV